MKKLILLILLSWAFTGITAQDTKPYNPKADAGKDIQEAIELAQAENKHILLMVGGNWCPWCRKLNSFLKENNSIDSLLKADFILVKVNYSKENKNLKILAKYDYPQRFGFPVLLVLDADGKRIHTQNTVYLEEGKGYNADRIISFLKAWRPEALNPENYD
ncbi:MAG: thioredoxin family protein [Bacteroidota bacterium]